MTLTVCRSHDLGASMFYGCTPYIILHITPLCYYGLTHYKLMIILFVFVLYFAQEPNPHPQYDIIHGQTDKS